MKSIVYNEIEKDLKMHNRRIKFHMENVESAENIGQLIQELKATLPDSNRRREILTLLIKEFFEKEKSFKVKEENSYAVASDGEIFISFDLSNANKKIKVKYVQKYPKEGRYRYKNSDLERKFSGKFDLYLNKALNSNELENYYKEYIDNSKRTEYKRKKVFITYQDIKRAAAEAKIIILENDKNNALYSKEINKFKAEERDKENEVKEKVNEILREFVEDKWEIHYSFIFKYKVKEE